jgi:hypothetical protein
VTEHEQPDTWTVWGDEPTPHEENLAYDDMKNVVDLDTNNMLYGQNDRTGDTYPQDA